MEKSRILWVDYSKAFLIFCVVLLHINIQDPYNQLINIFLIPFFIFLSGLFSNPSRYSNYFQFVKKKEKRILIPYLFFNIITYLFWLLLGRHFGLDSESHIKAIDPLIGALYSTSTRMHHYVPLWFLACLFSVETIHYLVFRKITTIKYTLIAVFVLGVLGYINYSFNKIHLPWSFDIAMVMIIFYTAGSIYKKKLYYKTFSTWQHILNIIISSVFVFVIFAINTPVKAHNNEYGNFLYFLIGAFFGISLFISTFKLLEKYLKPSIVLEFVGKNTLIILALHLISGSVIKAISVYVLKLPLSIYDIGWVKLFYAVLSIAILYPVILFFNKYLPILVGKSTLKS